MIATATGSDTATILVAVIGAIAIVIAACLPALLSRSSRSVKILEEIRNDARLHRERDDVRFSAIFGQANGTDNRPLRDPWPLWDETSSTRRRTP
jgi:hypothetical protein